jgi:aspartyl protease family protein
MIRWALRQLALWGALAFLLYAVVDYHLPVHRAAQVPPARQQAAAPAPPAVPNTLVFQADPEGHVVLNAEVNGAPVRFLVDTGATMVVLTMRDAAAAGLSPDDLNFSLRTATANGVVRAAPIRLREIRIGQLEIANVPAAVVEHVGISLLGQSFLTRLDGYEMHEGRLTLSYR